jgi:hypothetical protein
MHWGNDMTHVTGWTVAGLVFAALAMGLAAPAQADCATRHFYNNTNTTFELSMGTPGTCSIGPSGNVSRCYVPPHGSAELHYPNGVSVSSGALAVRSDDAELVYPLMAFPVSVSPGRCYLNHDGNTGNITVNEPADGDVTTCGAKYTCKIPTAKKKAD